MDEMTDDEARATDPPWDDEQWRVASDNAWTAGCRWLQGRWRSEHLDESAGERTDGKVGPDGDRLRVTSMLPKGADPQKAFLNEEIHSAVRQRLAEGGHSGIIEEDRLFRNLLSSQPACFNLFGPFVRRPEALLPWVRTIDADAETVEEVGFEWAPSKERHFGGGSAFDAVVWYRSSAGGRRLLGVECKYAEDLAASSIGAKADTPYGTFTRDHGYWREGAVERLDQRDRRQIWLNTLLAHSCARSEPDVDAARCVVVACAADAKARGVVDAVAAQLTDRRDLVWSPYEALLLTVDAPDLASWRGAFADRYLRFDRVAYRLGPDDARLASGSDLTARFANSAERLQIMAERVAGVDGSILSQLVEAARDGRLESAASEHLLDATARSERISEDLRALRANPLFELHLAAAP